MGVLNEQGKSVKAKKATKYQLHTRIHSDMVIKQFSSYNRTMGAFLTRPDLT